MPNKLSRNPSSLVLFLTILGLFFLSGASGLVYQVIWVRLLTRVFGTTTFAVSSLLAAFMAGLGLGAYLASRYLGKVSSPLRWFGLLEIGIGVYGVSLHFLLPLTEHLFLGLLSGWELSLYGESLLKVILSFIILLPPTTLMGASLPLLARQSVDRMGYLGVRTGSLYALNTFGAAAGCFAAGFYAIPLVGLAATTWMAAATNSLVGLIALILSWFAASPEKEKAETVETSSGTKHRVAFGWAMAAFTVSGFAAIGLEVIWTRLFTLVFKGYTYSFSSMLTVLLLGLAAGSIVFARPADRSHDLQGMLGRLHLSIAVAVLALSPLFVVAESILRTSILFLGHEWQGQTLAKFLISLLILFIPTFLFGAQFPVVTRLGTSKVEEVGSRVGQLYAANVAGSIFGALITGYVLIPLMGTHKSLWLIGCSLLVSGALLVRWSPDSSRRGKRWQPAAAFAAVALVFALSPSNLSKGIHEAALHNTEFISFFQEGATATVMVADFPPGSFEEKRILVNGSSASNSSNYGLSVNRVQGCLPFLFEQMPKRALAICFGTGITFGTLSQFDVERIDGVEISPEVIKAASEFGRENYDVVNNDRVRIHIDDGRNFLLKSKEKYDVITMEPMPPALAGVADMYTAEFYQLCRDHLTPDGIMSQWVPLYYLGSQDVAMLYRTFAESFPHVLLFFYNYDTFLVGSDQPLKLSPLKFLERLQSEQLMRDLAAIDLAGPVQILGTFLTDRESVLALGGSAPLITDDLPYVEFTAPKVQGLSTTAGNYLEVTRHAKFVGPYLSEDSGRLPESAMEALRTQYESNQTRWEYTRKAQAGWDRERETRRRSSERK